MLLEALFPKRTARYDPTHNFWYEPVGGGTRAGVDVNDKTADASSAVWACTRLLSSIGGSLPLKLKRKLSNGGSETASEHSLHRILHREPNPEMSSMMFRAMSISHQVNAGNSYAEIERNGIGGVVALWPIHPSRVEVKRNDNEDIIYWIRNNDLTMSPLSLENMFHVPSVMSDDGIVGKGVIRAAMEAIGYDIAMQRSSASYFGQGSWPGVVLKHPGKLNDKARATLRREWREMHEGPNKAYNTALLQEGMDLIKLGYTPEEAQFIASRQHSVEDIARYYGVPPHLIQHLLRSTFGNIEQQSLEFAIYFLAPWLELREQEIDRRLLKEDEKPEFFAKHSMDALLRGDMKTRTESLARRFMHGQINLDEWREIEDLNPLPDGLGQIHFIPTNLTTIEKARDLPAPGQASTPFGQPDDDEDEEDEEETKEEIEDEEEDDDESANADEQMAAIRKAALQPIHETLDRLAKKEINAIRRAAKDAKTFPDWMEEFYPKHQGLISEALEAATAVWATISNQSAKELADRLAEHYVAMSIQRLDVIVDSASVTTFPAAVDSLLESWSCNVGTTIHYVLEHNNDNVS